MKSKPFLAPCLGVALVLALSACATNGKHSANARYSIECTAGGTFVNVHYGDSELKVHPVANVHRGSALEFRLKPNRRNSDKVNYENVKVKIKGAKTPPASWIDLEGTFTGTNGKMVVCVPDSVARGTYYYEVKVDGVGVLDPRADVTK